MKPHKKEETESVKYSIDESIQITDEDCENDLWHKHVSMGLYNTSECGGGNQLSFQIIDCYYSHVIQTLNRKSVIMNRERVSIVDHIVQLIINVLGKTPCLERSEMDYNWKTDKICK